MKRPLVIFFLIINCCVLNVTAHTDDDVNSLMTTFKTVKNADYHHIGSLLFTLAKVAVKGEDSSGYDALNYISSIKVLDLSNCSDNVKNKFWTRAKLINDNRYQELVRQSTKDGFTDILVRMRGSVVRELIIVSAGSNDGTLVMIRGKIPLDKLSDVIDSQHKK